MTDVISEYQRWKQQGEDLRAGAKHAMESRFRELLSAAVEIAEEYRADFGGPLKPPPPVTAFRYKVSPSKASRSAKAASKAKPAKSGEPAAGAQAKPEAAAPPKIEPPPAKLDPKVAGLQKRLATARKKLDEAKAAGTSTRVLEDRIYEIEDALRLAVHAG